ncbi:MAG TPA: hypothetical protein VKY36_02710, partial [Moheibacter sp.]|nr:hypothetical protein [Moheibacter sp.]
NSNPEEFIPYNEHEFMGTYPSENPDAYSESDEHQYSPQNYDYETAENNNTQGFKKSNFDYHIDDNDFSDHDAERVPPKNLYPPQ